LPERNGLGLKAGLWIFCALTLFPSFDIVFCYVCSLTMGFLHRIFGARSNPAPDQPDSRAVVFDFANVFDALLLPHPKSVIYDAFRDYMAQLQAMRRTEELQEVQKVYMYISHFQEIDPEDRTLVTEINAGKRFEKYRSANGLELGLEANEPDAMIFDNMKWKYRERSNAEFETIY
jgi:hypothetical protein